MKNSKILVVLLAVALVVALSVVGFVVNAEDVVTIATAEEYNTVMGTADNMGKTIELTANIDFTNVANGNVEAGTFTGTFDGKGFAITGIDKPLFAQLNGTVQNLTFEGKIVKTDRDIGSLAEKAQNFTVKNVVSTVDMEITARDLNVGGIIGYPKAGTFENVTYAGDTVVNWYNAAGDWGAMGGYVNNGGGTTNYINCTFAGSVTIKATEVSGSAAPNGARSAVGAFAGNTKSGTQNFVNCINVGTITHDNGSYTPNTYAAGLVGYNQTSSNKSNINVTNCVNLGNHVGTANVGFVVADGEKGTITLDGPGKVRNGYNRTSDVVTTLERDGDTYKIFFDGTILNLTDLAFAEEIPATLLADDAWTAAFATVGEENAPAITLSFVDATLAEKISSGAYDLNLSINGKKYTSLDIEEVEGTLVIDLAESKIYAIEAEKTYTLAVEVEDVPGYTLVYGAKDVESTVTTVPGFTAGIVEEGILSSTGFSAYISSKVNTVGGKSDLRIVLVASYEVLCENDDATLTVDFGNGKAKTFNIVDDLHVYQTATAAGITYTAAEGSVIFGLVVENIPNSAFDTLTVTLESDELEYASSISKEDAITHQTGTRISCNNYGFEDHHGGDLNYTAAWVGYVWNGLARKINNRDLIAKVVFDGEAYEITKFNNYVFDDGQGYLRLGLESAGITGIERGSVHTVALQIYDAEGNFLYYTDVHTVTSNIFSTDIPTNNIDLPTSGIKEVTVSSYDKAGINVWNANTESVAQLFDGNTSTTKMGGGVDEVNGKREVTVSFTFAEATKVTYYTLYSGNDTDTGSNRNPKEWILYGNVNGTWVVLDTEGFDAPTGMGRSLTKRATPASYAVANPQACTEYKIVFTTDSQFQLNELKLYVNDATATTPTAAAIIAAEDAEVVLIHRNDYLKNDAEYQFSITTKGDGNYFQNNSIVTIADRPMWVYINDTTAGTGYVKYDITNFKVQAHAYISFNADGFTPVEGHSYDIVLIVHGGEGTRYGECTYAIPSWGFQLGLAAKGF